MSDNQLLFAALKAEAETKPVKSTKCEPKAAMILDMGEASREQGFRLNGCR